MLASPDISAVDKLRLGLLYALRYESTADLPRLKDRMVEGGVPSAQVDLIDKLLQYAGQVSWPPKLLLDFSTHVSHRVFPHFAPHPNL